MKMPCELVVNYVLPTAKCAMAKELVTKYGMRQTDVARLFGVTPAAISQYMSGNRGGSSIIDESEYRDGFYGIVMEMADSIAAGMDTTEALCHVCEYAKSSGLLTDLYMKEGYDAEAVGTFYCPRQFVETE